ncbi:general substrate transporter [Kockovaella imperatae]|uniref:General substrate transporter n=1 Tax=Kockovaella imperatae TaxID=4999 RepID=A0A1Y1UPX3_9TREE|nr:general substrate transporter [Kockovaella imperatae]ORX40108.1 general substrate transporter [Kockovaella imperatae]
MPTVRRGYLRTIASNFNPYLAFCTIILGISSCNQAFETNAIGTTQAMPYFARQFGVCDAAGKCQLPTNYLALLNAIPAATQALGVLCAGLLMNIVGRRWSNFLMCAWAIMGAVLMVTAKNRAHLMAARLINYMYYGAGQLINSTYCAELVPEQIRGIAVGAFYVSFTFAALVMSGVLVGTATIQSNASWQIPFALWFPMPIICCIATYWLVESPRYLLMKGKDDQAREALKRLRVDNSDHVIGEELMTIKLALEVEGAGGKWRDLIRGTNLRRTLLCSIIAPASSASGNSFTSSYGPIFISTLHSISAYDFNLIGSVIGFLGCVVVMVYMDKFGRRPLIITSALAQSAFLLAMASTGLQKPKVTQAGTNFIVACVLLFNTSFHTGYASTIHAILAELPEQTVRAKTQLVAQITNVSIGVGVSYATPYMFRADAANLGPKVGFVFLPINLFVAAFVYFGLPELKGRSLEEIDLLFMLKIGARQSVSWKPENTAAGLMELIPEAKTGHLEEIEDKPVVAHIEGGTAKMV